MARFVTTWLLLAAAGLQSAAAIAQQQPEPGGSQPSPAALSDLAAAQFQRGDIAGAEDNYLRALTLLEDLEGISSPHFVAPLAGLGAIYANQGRHELAIDFYRRAIVISHRAHGLFNSAQTPLQDALASSYMALGLYTDAEACYRYLVQIAARNYGADDLRTLPALWQLGQWYESVYNYLSARLTYAHIYNLVRRESGNKNRDVIEALLAIARMYRMHFWDDPAVASQSFAAAEQLAIGPLPGIDSYVKRDFETFRLDRNGQRALQRALDVLEDQEDPPIDLLLKTLVEFGDWYMASRQPDLALDYYGRAARLAAARAPDTENPPLQAPRLAVYHAPASATTYRLLPHSQLIVRNATFTLTVNARGEPTDITLVSSDMSDMQTFQVRQALQGARFSPRYEGEQPVATAGVEFTGQWYDRVPTTPTEPASTAAGGN